MLSSHVRHERPALLIALSALCAAAIAVGPAQSRADPEDWVILASNSDAAMGIDRNTIAREDDQATARILMGTFRPEVFDDGSTVSYYVIQGSFDCRARTRAEQAVTTYGPTGMLIGSTAAMPESFPVQPGSLTDHILIAACGGAADGPGFDRPLDAIAHERDKRVSEQRPVND